MEDSKLEKIEGLYRQYDFMKIISKYWSNHSEYDSEALDLALKLHRYDSVASIQQKVWDIFYNFFCISFSYRKRPRIVRKDNKEEAIKKIGDLDKYLEFSQKIKEVLDE